MRKSGLSTNKVTRNERFNLRNVTSLTIVNGGATDITVFGQVIAPVSATSSGVFVMAGDGTYTDLDFEIQFSGGTGLAYLNYRSLVLQTENCNYDATK